MRPVHTLKHRSNDAVSIFFAIDADGAATESESTTGNRIVRYQCRCKSCMQMSFCTKQTLQLGRGCPICGALWPGFRPKNLAKDDAAQAARAGTYTMFYVADGEVWIAPGSRSETYALLSDDLQEAWATRGVKSRTIEFGTDDRWMVFCHPDNFQNDVKATMPLPPVSSAPSLDLVRELDEARGAGAGLRPACASALAPDQDSDWVFMRLEEWNDIRAMFSSDSSQEMDNRVLEKYPDYEMRRSWTRTSLGHVNPGYVYVYPKLETFDFPF